MNRNNPIERHLLSRCYSTEAEIEELLSTRYSITGDQKPTLLLIPTGQKNQPKPKSLFHKETNYEKSCISPDRIKNTRNELRLYIKQTVINQKRLIKKIQAYNRKETSKSKPFPIDKLLIHYSIPQYEEFENLNNLWQSYMQNLLFPTKNIPSITTLLPKLSTADFTGCLLTVIHSANTKLVGVRGIVIWDTQHNFILCSPRNEDSKEWNEIKEQFTPSEQVGGLKVIPKRNTLFAFDIVLPCEDSKEEECIGFTIIGSRFEFRTVDRSGKKFKGHKVDDIL